MTTKRHFLPPTLCALVLASSAVRGQQTPPPEAPDAGPTFTLEAAAAEPRNRIGVSYRMGLNLSVDFKKLGGRAGPNVGPATGSVVDRNYDNGYNRVDSLNNNHGFAGSEEFGTWYWGYQNASQDNAGAETLLLQSYSTAANGVSRDNQDDPQHGLELTYSRELYRAEKWRAGIEGAFGYMQITASDNRPLRNGVARTTDAYGHPGVFLPPAPYLAARDQGGVIINSEPTTRSLDRLPQSALITGTREFDADLYSLRLGPYVEIPLYKKLSLIVDGGLFLGLCDSQFSFAESVAITDPPFLASPLRVSRAGAGSETDFVLGGYAGGSFAYALTEKISVLAGAHFQGAGESVNKQKGKESVLNLGESIMVSVGVSYAF